MTLPLFRTEVLQARRQRWLGDVLLDAPPTLRALSLGALAAALLVAWLLAAGQYTRRTRVAGQLVPDLGITTIAAPQAGVAARVLVGEGERVRARQALALLSAPQATRADGDSVASVARTLAGRRRGLAAGHAAALRQLLVQEQGLQQQLMRLGAEARHLDQELQARHRQHALARQLLVRHEELHRRRYITALQWQQQQSQVLELQAAVSALARQREAARRLADQVRQQRDEMPDRRAQLDAAHARDLASLEQEGLALRARSEALVQAPLAGTVGSVLVSAGQPVLAGQALMSLLPAGSLLQAHLQVPSAAVGFVAPGDTVLVRYAAFPYQRFGHQRGHVLRVSRTALAGREAAGVEPYYRVVVALEQQGLPAGGRLLGLRAGLALEADILGERRPLWQWALQPLQSLAGRISEPARQEQP